MSSTELEPYRIGPTVALRLGGIAKEIALAQMKRPAYHPASGVIGNSLQYGETMDFEDGLGLVHRTGVDILVHNISEVRPADPGITIKLLLGLFRFRRVGAEHPDGLIARWELLRTKARNEGD